jgi:pimeloyl-ACP methyl ester carboxylesterase
MAVPNATHAVHSRDGTRIGYSRSGDGPGLILLRGALQTSRSFSRLAAELGDNFTIYVPDRRGRGLSGPPAALARARRANRSRNRTSARPVTPRVPPLVLSPSARYGECLPVDLNKRTGTCQSGDVLGA